jgi:hypothetical protein
MNKKEAIPLTIRGKGIFAIPIIITYIYNKKEAIPLTIRGKIILAIFIIIIYI